MIKLTLTRIRYEDRCTIGVLEVGGEKLYTIELQKDGNKPNISCIPEGFYEFEPHGWGITEAKFKKVWEIKDVPERSSILFHAGNRTEDTEGCVLVGKGIHSSNGDHYVINSRTAVNIMRAVVGDESGILEIKSIQGS